MGEGQKGGMRRDLEDRREGKLRSGYKKKEKNKGRKKTNTETDRQKQKQRYTKKKQRNQIEIGEFRVQNCLLLEKERK